MNWRTSINNHHGQRKKADPASTYAFAGDGVTRIPSTILFDSSSQRSYVSKEAKNKLSLSSEHSEIMNINTLRIDKHEKQK